MRKRRYGRGKADPQKILNYIYHEISREIHDWRESWDILVELVADKLRPGEIEATAKYTKNGEGFSLLPETKHKKLAGKYSAELEHYIISARKDPWDHLGEIRTELVGLNMGQVLTPRQIVEAMCKMTLDDKPWETPKNVLDPCTGTGRFLIVPSIQYPDYKTHPMILYGIEIDISLYRAAVVNLSMFSKHPFAVIRADALRLDIDKTGPGGPVWLTHGNRWDPPDITPYYYKPPPPYKFSLNRLAGAMGGTS